MPSDDLKHYATSDTDFYELLGITFETSQKDIDRAWRRTALKYHPDKVGNANLVARDKFHLAQIGYDLLSDPASKAIYDNARTARLQRKRQNELFEGRRRQMKDDLEMRERGGGVKRPRDEGEVEEERLQMEIRRLAEDGKRRRKEREEALRRDLERETAAENKSDDGGGGGGGGGGTAERADASPAHHNSATARPARGVADIDRTVKVRWPIDGEGGSITADRVKEMFSRFGKIDSADLLSPKMLRLSSSSSSSSKKKQLAVVCMVQYSSVVGAHAAVEDFPKQQKGGGSAWTVFDSVSWAANKEPDFINNGGSQQRNGEDYTTPATPSTPASNLRKSSTSSNPFAYLQSAGGATTPKGSSPTVGDLKKKPSFASFSPAVSSHSTPRGSPFGKGLGGPNSPSLEELTMIRLKEAEKRRLAAEIQRQDDEADAAKEVNGGL